jgi:hypothetical protein
MESAAVIVAEVRDPTTFRSPPELIDKASWFWEFLNSCSMYVAGGWAAPGALRLRMRRRAV